MTIMPAIRRLWLAATITLLFATNCTAQEVTYGVGSWPESMGNHRARVRVTEKADAVLAHIPWRRPDQSPQKRSILIVESSTGKTVDNFTAAEVAREFGDIVFQPAQPGDYEIYYMLYTTQERKADTAWLQRLGTLNGEKRQSLPQAQLIDIQARTEFDRFDPMEVIATRAEVDELLKRNPLKSMLLFPEDRRYPIKMADYLPQRWIASGPHSEFQGEAARGEFYTFQVGIYAARAAIDSGKEGYNDVKVGFSDLRSASGGVIPSSSVVCPSLAGIDWLGYSMGRSFKVALGKVRPLWFGVQVPEDVPPGDYSGSLVIKPSGAPESILKLTLTVIDKVLKDAGDSDPRQMSRLWWLDSRIGVDDDVVAPYAPIVVAGSELRILGRRITISKPGLPESIKCGEREVLAKPARMIVETTDAVTPLSGGSNPKDVKESPGRIIREYATSNDVFQVKSQTITDFDGYSDFHFLLKARKDAQLKDIRLEIPIEKDVATYMMGLARQGGLRPREWNWNWDIDHPNNMVWIGDVDAGLQLKLKGSDDAQANGLPKSWDNGHKGGCTVIEQADCILVRAYSGGRTVKQDDEISFKFSLLMTPVKPLDKAHWTQRRHNTFAPVDQIKAAGANVGCISNACEPNPYTNYPFLATDKLASYVKDARANGIRVTLDYNTGELSNHCPEIWALRSLGDEVLTDGPGGGNPWLQEHLSSHYTPARTQSLWNGETDAAVAVAGLSRWNNYYAESLAWLAQTTRLDGLCLNGVGYDRETMKRVRKVLNAAQVLPTPAKLDGGTRLIDVVSPNEFVSGNLKTSPACLYMEHFPYIDTFSTGDLFDSSGPPDYWLVEMSGIPFGVFGHMRSAESNPYKGMLFGMTTGTGGTGDPKAIWKLWDDFGIKDAKMTGYWSPDCPVKTDNKDVLATVYSKAGKALISIASWAKEPAKIKLTIDWKALGIDIRKADLRAPAIEGFQDATDLQWSGEMPVKPGKGWLLILEEK